VKSLTRSAERRGHTIAASRKTKQLFVKVGEHSFTIKLSEDIDQVPKPLQADDPRVRQAYSWQRINPPEYEAVPSGRLRVELSPRTPHAREWADQGRSKIESSIRELIGEAERQADQAEKDARERQRRHEAWLVEYHQQQDEEKRQKAKARAAWERTMADARTRAVEDLRRQAFGDALAGWALATQIRDFCTALAESATDAGEPAAASEWVAWAAAWADTIDPTGDPSGFADRFHPEPGPDDLRPHLGEWSPFKPEKEHRHPPKPERPATSSYAEGAPAWIWARRGRFPWWRL
jgi:hypothetical protein